MRATRRTSQAGHTIIRSLTGEHLARHCTSCKQMLPRSSYSKSLRGICKPCATASMKSNPRTRLHNYVAILRTKERNSARPMTQVIATRNRLRPSGLKTCAKCKEDLTFDKFLKDRSLPDGLTYSCKECVMKTRKG